MSLPQKSKKGILILSIGLFAGLCLGIATCYVIMSHQAAPAQKAANPASVVTTVSHETLPIPLPPPAPAAPTTSVYEAQLQLQQQQPMPMQGFAPMPAAPMSYTQDNGMVATANPAYGSVPTTEVATETVGTSEQKMGANGLLQNPCVDPPSSHGRAFRITGQY